MSVVERLEQLRKLMKENSIDVFIIPSSDPHQSEYVAGRWKTRAWISGFTGSAGTVVVTADKAGLWTDGRYFLQAEEQLKGSTIELFKMGLPETVDYTTWINSELNEGQVVSFDPAVLSIAQVDGLKAAFKKKKIKVASSSDLINEIWTDRPVFPDGKAVVQSVEFCGMERSEKFAALREKMAEEGVTHHLFASLDDIAWIFNVRGTDVKCNPVVMSYAVVGIDEVVLFINADKVEGEVRAELEKDGVTIKDYAAVTDYLSALSEKSAVFIDTARSSQNLLDALKQDKVKVVRGTNMSQIMKAVKNDVEIKGMKKAHIVDGVAMVKFLHWIDNAIGKEEITEISASDKLEDFRKEGENFRGLSFDSISGYNEHGAIIHYSATPETSSTLKPEGFLLMDSGGQYLDGTTDITRTIVLGDVSDRMKRDYTLVLKGHIKLSMTKFPQGFTTGAHIDAFARDALWQHGINYNHGTGHGVGAYLGVHEGPMGISPRWNDTKLVPGMIMSNEPGCYRGGEYGIRIENLVLVVPVEETEWGQFLTFENVTMCPIDTRAVDVSLLTEEEREWLNRYHEEVYEKLSPMLDEEVKGWLRKMTEKI
jgi:Xaa-Pro aminopeptidase